MLPRFSNRGLLVAARAKFAAFRRDRRGNIAILSALLMPAVLGTFGLGTEVASWHANQRAMQNAADSAAVAAATNASDSYAVEARAVTARYGLNHGQQGVAVTVVNGQSCPDGQGVCYRVTITKPQALILAQLVGYGGDTTLAGSPAKRITATALAIQASGPRPYCVLALAGSGASDAIRSNGAASANLSGCNLMSNTGARCNGHNLGADFGDARITNNGCGVKQTSGMSPVIDPYFALASRIPSDPCGGVYPRAPSRNNDPPLPVSNRLSGGYSWGGAAVHKCGDIELTGPMQIDSTGDGALLVIHNGRLDTNGYTLKTQNGGALTVVFTGSDGDRTHTPVGGGRLDFRAPSSGPWTGVAIYQDPAMTGGVDISEAGNSPAWDITGLVYLPKASVTFSGAVNKSSEGASCFVLVVDDILINGTGAILEHGECKAAGLDMPVSMVPMRGQLVS